MDEDAEMDSMYGAESPKKGPSKSMDEEEQASTTAIVPTKVLMGKDRVEPKEGDERVVKVVKNFGDECEIMYAPEKPSGSNDEENEEIDSMDKAGGNPGRMGY